VSRRNLSKPGLSYVDANKGRVGVYTFEKDVEEARARIEREYPTLRVLWDFETKEHLIVEKCLDGVERLYFATKTFYEDEIRERIRIGDDAARRNEDPFDAIERANEEREKRIDAELADKIGDVGQKLAHAFAKDGLTVRPRMVPRSIKLRSTVKSVSNRAGV
jgi:hypothetical protein